MMMRKFAVRFFFLLLFAVSFSNLRSQSPSFRTYINPVIPGDHPDATLTRVGKDFYTTGSSFNVTPVIYHSTDLVHWEAISQPVSAAWSNYGNSPGGGAWGGHIVFHKNKYWHFFSRANVMHVVNADQPEGPWSSPVRMNQPASLPYGLGYDNSVFIDDDNKWYLVVKNGQPNNGIVELGDDGQPSGLVYNLNWLNPSPYPYSWAEGPVMWKAHGYYYYSFARDLSGGQKVMRSSVLTADQSSWEMLGDFFNQSDPLKSGSLFTEPNHSSPAIMLDDSTSWVIHPLYAKGEWKGQGRQGLLNQVKYNAGFMPVADYPVNKYFTSPVLNSSGIPWMVPKSDNFSSDKLNPEWSFMGYTPDASWSLGERRGWLRLSPRGSVISNSVLKNDGEHGYSLITRLDFNAESAQDEAGLRIIRGDETKYVKLYSGYNNTGKMIALSFENILYSVPNTIGSVLWLKLVRMSHIIYGYYSNDGVSWIQIGQGINAGIVDSYSDFSSFTGTRQGLYIQHKAAYFDLYIYRDAYTPTLASSYANQFGITRTSADIVENIHNNDWVLYAGVEFGNSNYRKKADSVSLTTAGLSSGFAEVWLDSIETGLKAGVCEITSTGGNTAYKEFRSIVMPVTGRHDVYIRFTGGEGTICRFKSLKFLSKTGPRVTSAATTSIHGISVQIDKKVVITELPSGIRVFRNNTECIIDSISQNPGDSSEIRLIISDSIQFGDQLHIDYESGTIQSADSLELIAFSGKTVFNNMPDPYPHLLEAVTNTTGDMISLHFNMKMSYPGAEISGFQLLNSGHPVVLDSVYMNPSDSAGLMIIPDTVLHAEDQLTLSYTGTSLFSHDGFALAQIHDYEVENLSPGYPPLITEAKTVLNETEWNQIVLRFDRVLSDTSIRDAVFFITVNSTEYPVTYTDANSDSIWLTVDTEMVYGDNISVSYSSGQISSVNKGVLKYFANYPVLNTIPQSNDVRNTDESDGIRVSVSADHDKILISSDAGFVSLIVYDIQGRMIHYQNYPDMMHETVIKLSSGLYLLRLNNTYHSSGLKVLIP